MVPSDARTSRFALATRIFAYCAPAGISKVPCALAEAAAAIATSAPEISDRNACREFMSALESGTEQTLVLLSQKVAF
jgi:hypothetical protein